MTDNSTKTIRVGEARLPQHDRPTRNTVSLAEALASIADRPDVLGVDKVDPAAIEIGIKIKRARLASKMSQADLARKTGLQQSAISLIESGKGQDGPTYRVLRELAVALGFSPELIPVSAVTVGVPAWANHLPEVHTYDTVRIVGDAKAFSLVEETTSLRPAMALIRSSLEPSVQQDLSVAVEDLFTARKRSAGLEKPLCSYWMAAPHQKGRINARRDLVVFGYSGVGTVRRTGKRNSIPSSDRVVVVPRKSSVEVANPSEGPFDFLTFPLNAAAAASLGASG